MAKAAAQVDVFRAVADPTRRAILDFLRKGPRSVNQIAGTFPVSRPAISKHLRVLRGSRLVKEHRQGRLHLYELNSRPLRNVDKWIGEYRIFWQKSLRHLKAYVESEK